MERDTLDGQARKDLYLLGGGAHKLRHEDENLPAPHRATGRTSQQRDSKCFLFP